MDAFPSDFLIVDGKKRIVPRYYLKRLQADPLPENEYHSGESMAEEILERRKQKSFEHAKDQTSERLAVREECHLLRAARLKRQYEEEN